MKYGNFDRHTSPKLLYSARLSVFAFELPTGCNLDDLLGERDVGVQTYNPHAFRETSELKKRHSLRMRRLNKQARDLRKMLAFQCKWFKYKLYIKLTNFLIRVGNAQADLGILDHQENMSV